MIVFSNEERITVTLDTGQPPATPATFYFRPMTLGEFIKVTNLQKDIEEASNASGKFQVIVDVLTRALIGWNIKTITGQDVPFNKDDLANLLPMSKATLLLMEMLKAQSPTGDDRGK